MNYFSKLKPFEREGYEKYCLADTLEGKLNALQTFVEGSELYNYLYLVTKMRENKCSVEKLNAKDKELFEKVVKSGNKFVEPLRAMSTLYEFDETYQKGIEKDWIKSLEKIRDKYFSVDLNPQKPRYAQNIVIKKMNEAESSEDEAEKPVTAEEKKKATIPADLLNEEAFIRNIISEAEDATRKKKEVDEEHIHLQILKKMPVYLVHSIDFGKFDAAAVYKYTVSSLVSQQLVSGIQNKSFLAQIKAAINQKKKDNNYWENSIDLCNAMTIEQLQQLKAFSQGSTDPNVIGALFSKRYSEQLSSTVTETMTNLQKYENMIQVFRAAKAESLPRSLQMQLLGSALTLGPKACQFDVELFNEFVKWMEHRYGGGTTAQKIGTFLTQSIYDSHSSKDWSSCIKNLGNSYQFDYAPYLKHFAFERNGDLSAFKHKSSSYLTIATVEAVEDRVNVYLAKNGMTSFKDHPRIDHNFFKTVSDEVNLTFTPDNQDKFKPSELVELKLEIKNVGTVHARIFEFNTETYYRKNMKTFDTSIDLDGLESTVNKTFDFSNLPANFMTRKNFQFPELNGRVGLFIVEFVGNGRSARAVIKKGSLSLIFRSTVAGHLLYILDDDKKICKGGDLDAFRLSPSYNAKDEDIQDNKTGVFFEKKFYEADKVKGTIFIPYGKNQVTEKIIMKHGSFAQMGEFTRKTEVYSFNCTFYLNGEQVLVGNSAHIVIRPQLLINGRQASLDQLKNAKATISTVNYIDNIPITKNFENLKVTDDQEIIIDFQVPPNLESVKVDFSAQVLNNISKVMENFSAKQKFKIDTHKKDGITQEFHLRFVQGKKYEIHCLGKNGEPRPYFPVQVTLTSSRLGNKNCSLVSDRLGKIYLDKLESVLSIKCASEQDSSIYRFWNIYEVSSDIWSYPQEINVIENGSVEIPIAQMWDKNRANVLSRNQVSFYRTLEDLVVEDCFESIQLIPKQHETLSHYNLLRVSNLKHGTYFWNIRGDINYQIQIVVHKGVLWNNLPNFIQQRNCIKEIIQSQKIVKIQETELSDKNSLLRIKLADFSKDARVHIIATKFVQPNNSVLLNNLTRMTLNQFSCSVYHFAMWSNFYLSDRILGDEFRYVFDRAHAQRMLGNTLDRPQLVNKRLFTRKTEMDQEVLQSGTNFAHKQEVFMQQAMPRMQQMAMPAASYMMTNSFMPAADEKWNERKMMSQINNRGGESTYQIPKPQFSGTFWATELQNFMKISPLQVFNIKPDTAGNINYRNEKLKNYSSLLIVVADKDSVTQHLKSLEEVSDVKCPSRDLTLKKALDENKGLTESRISLSMKKGQSDFIEDITSSEVKIIDDLQKVNEILLEIQKFTGNGSPVWQKLKFVNNWSNLTQAQKDNNLSEYSCHELHFFIKKRDPKYFEKTVRQVIKSKLEKSLVDKYLLDHFEEIVSLQSQQINVFSKLNAFEKCLFIDSFVQLAKQKNNNQQLIEEAKAYAKLMREVQNAYEKMNKNQRAKNHIFDLVLNLNSLDKSKRDAVAQSSNALNQFDPFSELLGQTVTSSNRAVNFGGPPGALSMQQQPMSQMNLQTSLFSNQIYRQPIMQTQQMNLLPQRQANPFASAAPQNNRASYDSQESSCEQEQKFENFDDDEDQRPMDAAYMNNNCDYNQMDLICEDPFTNSFTQNLINQQRQAVFSHEAFSQLEKTQEFAESFYYDSKLSHHIGQSKDLVKKSLFWCDYADFLTNQDQTDFLSTNFTECSSPIDAFFAGCLLSLPPRLQSTDHKRQADESRGLTITAGSNLIMFKKEIKNVEINLEQDFMVTHRYAREDGQGQQNEDEAIPNEFLINTPYSCEVIMTNVSPNVKEFNLLYQIPVGSMPIYKTKYMMSQPFKLSAYTTQRTKFYFYFPTAGEKGHYPSNVSVDDKVVSRGEFNILIAVKRRTIIEAKTFADLIQIGTPEQILKFIDTENWLIPSKGFQLSKIRHLCTDFEFWKECIKILRKKNHYSDEIWQFAFKHISTKTIHILKEYIQNEGDRLKRNLEPEFSSILIDRDVHMEFRTQQNQLFSKMLEYNPMINSRAHKIGQQGEQQILNRTFRETYHRFLQYVSCKRRMTYGDKLTMVYYLQLQDRIQEAINLFSSLQRPEEAMAERGEYQLEAADKAILEIQYDYMQAYFDFFTDSEGGYNIARKIVQRYDNYPISSWRLMFLAIQDQLDEFDGEFDDGGLNEEAGDLEALSDGTGSDATLRIAERKQENLKKSKKREPNMSNIETNDNGSLKIETVNIKAILVKYYIIDAEVMFSRAPFLQNNAEQFSYVKPYFTLEKTILGDNASEQDQQTYITSEIPLPEQLQHMNLVIEINGADKQAFRTFYGSALKVVILESYGELKVTHKESGEAVSKVYVKVFSQDTSGKDSFYRDGYTDIRGKFEYAQASFDSLSKVKKFAILIQSSLHGAQIREIEPPKSESGVNEMAKYAKIEGGGFQVQGYSAMQNLKCNRMWARNEAVKSKKK